MVPSSMCNAPHPWRERGWATGGVGLPPTPRGTLGRRLPRGPLRAWEEQSRPANIIQLCRTELAGARLCPNPGSDYGVIRASKIVSMLQGAHGGGHTSPWSMRAVPRGTAQPCSLAPRDTRQCGTRGGRFAHSASNGTHATYVWLCGHVSHGPARSASNGPRSEGLAVSTCRGETCRGAAVDREAASSSLGGVHRALPGPDGARGARRQLRVRATRWVVRHARTVNGGNGMRGG